MFVLRVSDLLWDGVRIEILLSLSGRLLSLLLLSRVSDCEGLMLLFDSDVGELWAVRYKLPVEARLRIDGSEKLAMALEVLSRASAANVKNPPRFCFDEVAIECVD